MFQNLLKSSIHQPTRHASTGIMKLGILGVPFNKGQSKKGPEQAPDVLRKAGLIEKLRNQTLGNVEIKDYGNMQYEPDKDVHTFRNMKNFGEFMGCTRVLIGKVQEILKENDQILVLGGDHAISFGTVAGNLNFSTDLSLVWIDAHADINLHMTSESGNTHGMPVSFLLQELRTYWEKAHIQQIAPHCVATDQLVYIGLRDIDPYEVYILRKLDILSFDMSDIDKYGISKIMEKTLDALNPKNKIHISIDVDGLDSSIVPSTGTAVHGGLTLREGLTVVEALRDTNRVRGIDLVELNPSIGSQQDVENSIASSIEILKSSCGNKRADVGNIIDKDLLKTLK